VKLKQIIALALLAGLIFWLTVNPGSAWHVVTDVVHAIATAGGWLATFFNSI